MGDGTSVSIGPTAAADVARSGFIQPCRQLRLTRLMGDPFQDPSDLLVRCLCKDRQRRRRSGDVCSGRWRSSWHPEAWRPRTKAYVASASPKGIRSSTPFAPSNVTLRAQCSRSLRSDTRRSIKLASSLDKQKGVRGGQYCSVDLPGFSGEPFALSVPQLRALPRRPLG